MSGYMFDESGPEGLGPYDPTSHCVKCGFSLPTAEELQQEQDTLAQEELRQQQLKQQAKPTKPTTTPKKPATAAEVKANPSTRVQAPKPMVTYCNGSDCSWDERKQYRDGGLQEHMHMVCQVCGYEWLTKPLDAGGQ